MTIASRPTSSRGSQAEGRFLPSGIEWSDPALEGRAGNTQPTDVPGRSISIASGCITRTERSKRRLEPKKVSQARTTGSNPSKRRMTVYRYIEVQFHWSEKRDGSWKARSCYIGGYPAGQQPKPNSRTAQRISLIESQIKHGRPYGETLEKLGLGNQLTKYQKY